MKKKNQKKLGTKASHGCVRLSIEDAKWMYDNIPRDTLVNIK
ncbi:L,D-transpeptidase [Clostridium sp. DMHC 10]|nr:L,D-transpeptidase [Clostridium sp. DMHC 10]